MEILLVTFPALTVEQPGRFLGRGRNRPRAGAFGGVLPPNVSTKYRCSYKTVIARFMRATQFLSQ